MQNCNKCGAELSEHESDLCSACASKNEQADEATEVTNDGAKGEDGEASDKLASSPNAQDDTNSDDSIDDNDMSDQLALITLTKTEQKKRLFITIAAGVVIVGLVAALIFVLFNPRNGSDSDTSDAAIEGLPAPDGGEIAEPDRETICPSELLERLRNYDGDDFSAFFTELMFQYSEDPGLFTAPGGYLFAQGMMVEEFHNAAAALEVGEFSDLVETIHGFHIIYRVPIDPDAILSGTQHTLRMIYSMNAIQTMIAEWIDNLEHEFTEEYNALDIVELFSVPDQDEVGLEDIDFEEIYAMYEPTTPMIVAGEYFITWEELFSAIYMGLASLHDNFGHIPDLSEPLNDDIQPLYEVLLEVSTSEMVSRLAVRYNASELNIQISEEDYEFIDNFLVDLIEQQGGEEEFLSILWEGLGIKNIELYMHVQISHIMPYTIFQSLYGEEGELFPTDEVLRIADEDGIIMAKHILISHESAVFSQ